MRSAEKAARHRPAVDPGLARVQVSPGDARPAPRRRRARPGIPPPSRPPAAPRRPGVDRTGTPQPAPPATARPKPSLSEVTRTAEAALWQQRHLAPDPPRAVASSSAPASSRHLGGAVVALDRPVGVGREQQVAAGRVEPEPAPGLGLRDRPEAPEVHAARQDRGRPVRVGRPGRPPSRSKAEREAPAIRSRRRRSSREQGPTSRWRMSVPWKVTTSGLAPASAATQPQRP